MKRPMAKMYAVVRVKRRDGISIERADWYIKVVKVYRRTPDADAEAIRLNKLNGAHEFYFVSKANAPDNPFDATLDSND